MARLVNIDEPHAPPEQRGLYALIDESGGTLAVGHLEPDGAIVNNGGGTFAPGSTFSLHFHVVGGIRP